MGVMIITLLCINQAAAEFISQCTTDKNREKYNRKLDKVVRLCRSSWGAINSF